jgi:hypothetical protein
MAYRQASRKDDFLGVDRLKAREFARPCRRKTPRPAGGSLRGSPIPPSSNGTILSRQAEQCRRMEAKRRRARARA